MNATVLIDENTHLKSEVDELSNKIVGLETIVADLEAKTIDLQSQLDWFRKQIFGKKSEKTISIEDQNQLLFGGIETEPADPKDKPVKGHTRKTRAKDSETIRIPDNTPIEKQIIDLPEEQKIDPEGNPLVKIGEEITSKLAHKPGSYYIKQTIRPKYATPDQSIIVVGQNWTRNK